MLAYRLAEGTPTQPASQRGVFLTIADQPFGRVLLVRTIVGLLGYATWRFVQAAVGRTPEAGRHSAIDRIAAVGSGAAYATFAVLAISILHDSTSDSPSPQELSQRFIEEPWGRAVVGLAGAVFVVMAAYQLFMAVTRRFCDDSKVAEMGDPMRHALRPRRRRRAARPRRRVRADRLLRPARRDPARRATMRSASTGR